MSNPATNVWGHLVQVGLQATILGAITSVTGNTGVQDTVVFTTELGDVISILGGDLSVSDRPYDSGHPGRTTFAGKAFKSGENATVSGVIESVTPGPWGATGQVTILTDFSGTLVTVSSGSIDTNS
jgi:hypothetical protein